MQFLNMLALSAAVIMPVASPAGAQEKEAPFGEGWEKTATSLDGGTYKAWVENGWLQACYLDKKGETDWQIVLARVIDLNPPVIREPKKPPEGEPVFEISYRGGRYFVRDSACVVRSVRERKGAAGAVWPALKPEFDEKSRSTGDPANGYCRLGESGRWFVVASGPSDGAYDFWVRLTPMQLLRQERTGRGSRLGGSLRQVHAGEKWFLDDGEMLVAVRGHEREIRKELELGKPAPPLNVRTLDGKPVSLDDYRGKYLLLDFWATWCGPCVKEVPHLKEVHEAFGQNTKFAMMSVSVDKDIDKLKAFLEEEKMPWLQCLGTDEAGTKTVREYGATRIPSIFLVGPDGKLIAQSLRGDKIKKAVADALGKL